MGHRISWDNEEHTVIFQEYTDTPSKDDLYHLAHQSAKMLAEVDHIVHLIIDERNINFVLNSADMRYLEKNTPPNQGACIMLIPKHKLRYKTVVQDIGRSIAPTAFEEPYFAETLEDARQFLIDNFGVNYASVEH